MIASLKDRGIITDEDIDDSSHSDGVRDGDKDRDGGDMASDKL
jgi:hypothetical protein